MGNPADDIARYGDGESAPTEGEQGSVPVSEETENKEVTNEQAAEVEKANALSKGFAELCKPVGDWLRENHHPHTKIIITPNSAELVEGIMGVGLGGLNDPEAEKPAEGE